MNDDNRMTKLSTEERLTPAQLEAIRERVEKATAGPWEYNAKIDSITAEDDYGSFIIADDTETVVDAEFIAHAREDIPKLLAEIERLRKEIAFLEIQNEFLRNNQRILTEWMTND